MKFIKTQILILIFFGIGLQSYSQTKRQLNYNENKLIPIRGSVYEKGTREPFKNVEVLVNGGSYTKTNLDGTFNIKARVGDQLVISHDDFETIYHTVTSDNRIEIVVITNNNEKKYSKFNKPNSTDLFNKLIDSADSYLKKDAQKSIQFIGDALNKELTSKQNAEAYELLGDVYTYWKQYDLAIPEYKISLNTAKTNSAKLKLAKAYYLNENYDNSEATYKDIKIRSLTNYQKVSYYEGLGDLYQKTKAYQKAIATYEEGLDLAKKYKIQAKKADLNSKIAETYSIQGNIENAKVFFDNSLDLAGKENKKRKAEEQEKVAEFNNNIYNYSDEILLRKSALNTIIDIEADSIIPNESPLTQQKQNYKIGTAYYLQRDYDSAIPYYEKSIKEADKKGDLVVKKDALRRLSDVYKDKGDTDKALVVIDDYQTVVDELYSELSAYALKEQEISQAARFRKNITDQQNRIASLESARELSRSKYELSTERNKRQELVIYSLIGGLILLLITAYFMFKYIKQQRLANNLLALKTLRSQMNPHFIFNALNSVNSFIATNDERTANKYLSDFSFLMRAVLENSEEDFIPLKKEIELLELYTKLEHFRFQDKFDYTITVDPSVNVDVFQIPPMLLQPYIENAVWHGLRYKTEKGHLTISIHSKNASEICIIVTDDGIGRARSKALKTNNQKKQNSKGMNNIKKRVKILNEMYKDKVDVTVEDFQDINDVGTKVVVTLKKD